MTNINVDEYINAIPMWAKKKNSLSDIRAFLAEKGNPDEGMTIIHVAGTNGKGSVCAYLTSVFGQAGYRVGTFISPHLIETRERFLYNGEMVREELYEESFLHGKDWADEMAAKGYCHPTYFEFLFYMAIDLFSRLRPDIVILETGLGGRLDATNVIRRPAMTIITSISLDHMKYLGDTIPKIASEKAGILKKGVPVIYDRDEKNAQTVIRERAKILNAPCYPVASSDYEILSYQRDGILCRFHGLDGAAFEATVPSAAEYQVMNALVAYRAAEVWNRERKDFPIAGEEIRRGISRMSWPARMEQVMPDVYLDGAHNDGGIHQFIRTASRLCKEADKRAFLLFSSVSEKEHGRMIQELTENLPLDRVVIGRIRSERGCDVSVMEQEFQKNSHCAVEVLPDVGLALQKLLGYRDGNHLLFCVGSLYLMGEIKEILRRKKDD